MHACKDDNNLTNLSQKNLVGQQWKDNAIRFDGALMAVPYVVRKTHHHFLSAPLNTTNDVFTKTGSGQT